MVNSVANIVLHIGLHKTGSTLIQNFCTANRDRLQHQGFIYPETPTRWGGHHLFAWSFNIGNPHYEPADGTSDELAAAMFTEMAGASNLLISTEDFEFVNPHEIKRILGDHTYRVICYLRRQDTYLESEYAQHIRMDETRFTGSIQDFYMRYDFMQRYDYQRLLVPWDQAFGPEALHIRPFERIQFHAGDLLQDFCYHAGINWEGDFDIPSAAQANVSMSAPVLNAMREINKLDLSVEDRNAVIDILGNYSQQGGGALLEMQVAEDFRRVFQPTNGFIARRYLNRNDGQLFGYSEAAGSNVTRLAS